MARLLAPFRALPRPARIAFLLAHVWLLVLQSLFFRHTYDDVFIVARYAQNIARGAGIVFNPGERVEGATSLIWTLLTAGACSLGVGPIFFMKLVGMLAVIAVLWLQLALASRLDRPIAGVISAWLTALTPGVALWSVNGLETGLQAFLVALALLFAIDDLERPRGFPHAAGVLLLAVLTRPEAILIAALYVGALVARTARRELSWQKLALACLVLGAGLVGVTAWRMWYFGSPLPNTFYAKMANPALWAGSYGFGYVHDFLRSVTWPLAAVAAMPVLGLRGAQQRGALVLAGAVACQVAFVLRSGGDWMDGHRFLVPIVPALWVLSAIGLAWLWDGVRARLATPARRLAVAGLGVCAFVSASSIETSELTLKLNRYSSWMEAQHASLGRWLKEAAPPQWTIAISDCGIIPYLSGLRTADLFGLTERFIARHDPATSAEYLLSQRRPELIVVASSADSTGLANQRRAMFPVDQALVANPEFWARYRYQQSWSTNRLYGLHLFSRVE